MRSGKGTGEIVLNAEAPHPPPAEEYALGRNLLGKGTREVRLIYTFLLFAFLMAAIGMAQSTSDQKPAAPDNTAAPAATPAAAPTTTPATTPENTAAPATPEKKGLFHLPGILHRGKKSTQAGKPPKPEKPATPAKPASDTAETTGPTAFVQAEATHFNMGDVATYDFDLGYKFNAHTSADIGLPLYTTRTPFPIISTQDWRTMTILGTPYIDIRYDTKHNKTNITTILTGAAGINMVKTYSDGRWTADWFNHFDRNYQILNYDATFTPFLNFGFGTGTIDRQVMARPYELARPYETLGQIGNGEVGGAFTFHKKYKLEGSAYGLSPVGPQKVFSRLVAPDSLLGWTGTGEDHNRFWDQFFETGGQYVNTYGAGPSRIARDNGYGMYLTVNRYKNFSVQLGYTRSVRYDYGAAFLMFRYNFTGILRNLTTGE